MHPETKAANEEIARHGVQLGPEVLNRITGERTRAIFHNQGI